MERDRGQGSPEGAPKSKSKPEPKEQGERAANNSPLSSAEQKRWEPESWRLAMNPDPQYWYEIHKKSQEKIEKRRARQRRYYHKRKEQRRAELKQGEQNQPEVNQIFPSPPKE